MRPASALTGILMLLALSGCERPGRELPDGWDSAAARVRGRSLFLEHCAICHGEHADGRGRRRASLSGRPADFTDPGWAARTSPGATFGTILDGKPGTSMPPWKVLGEPRIWDLVAYLHSVSEPDGGGP